MTKAEKTKQLIIEKTADIFNKKGYVGTSLSDLTAATGLTKGAIYGNFENKEGVAAAAFKYNVERLVKALEVRLAKETTYKNRLLSYVDFYVDGYNLLIERGGCPFINGGTDTDDVNSELYMQIREDLDMWKSRLCKLMVKGIENGEFDNSLDIDKFSNLFLGIVEGSLFLAKTTRSSKPLVDNLLFLKNYVREKVVV